MAHKSVFGWSSAEMDPHYLLQYLSVRCGEWRRRSDHWELLEANDDFIKQNCPLYAE